LSYHQQLNVLDEAVLLKAYNIFHSAMFLVGTVNKVVFVFATKLTPTECERIIP
jgi:hypothetical protein